MDEINRILSESSGAGEALKQLIALRKAKNPSFSLAIVAGRLGLRSKGHVSDMVRGRRLIPMHLASGLAGLFGLEGVQADYLRTLIEHDQLREGDRDPVRERLQRMRKFLRGPVERKMAGLPGTGSPFAFEVLCAFALYGNEPDLRALVEYFGRPRYQEVEQALGFLLSEGLILSEGGRYRLAPEHKPIYMLFASKQEAEVEFLRYGLRDAADKLAAWYGHQEDAFFATTTISVRREDYRRLLREFRQQMLRLQSDMEADNGDMLVRLNVQSYPAGKAPPEDGGFLH